MQRQELISMESMVLSSLSFRINLPTTFTLLSVYEQILRLPACIRMEACYLAVSAMSMGAATTSSDAWLG